MENTIKLLEILRDVVKEDKRDIAYVFNSLQRIITEAKGASQQSPKSAEEWLKKHHYVDSGIEWNPLPSTNEGMRVSISSVLDQFVSSQQPDEWVKPSDELTKIIQDRIKILYDLNNSDKVRRIWKEQLLVVEARRHELERLLKKL